MTEHSIYFQHLHILFKYVPKKIAIGSFSIALYGVVIACGIILAEIFVLHEARRTGQKSDDYLDLTIFGVIFGILGARIYYVIFSWDYYKDNLRELFNIRGGGLAIYGGVIGGVLTALVLCRVKKLSFPLVADTACFGLLIGQICGRWGNFFNREAFGGYTDNVFAMLLPIDAVNRPQDITDEMMQHVVTVNGVSCISVHPTFLYESLWNLGVFLFLLFFRKKKQFDGELFLLYLGLYGAGRFWIEALRTDQLRFAGTEIPVSRVLAAVLFAVSALLIFLKRLSMWKKKGSAEEA